MEKWKEVIARNLEEHNAFDRFLGKKSCNGDDLTMGQERSKESIQVELPPLAKLINILNTLNKASVPAEESIYFLRGLITEIGNLLEYLTAPGSQLTDGILRNLIEGGAMIKRTFELTEEFDGSDFDLNEAGIPHFLDVLTSFVFGTKTREITADVQGERMELVGGVMGQLRSRTLEPIVLRHLIAQTKAHFNRFSIGLKNVKKGHVVDFNVINSTFSILNLLEGYCMELEDMHEEDVTGLNSLVRVADSAFPGFPLLGVIAVKIANHGKEILRKQKEAAGGVQEDFSLNYSDLLDTSV